MQESSLKSDSGILITPEQALVLLLDSRAMPNMLSTKEYSIMSLSVPYTQMLVYEKTGFLSDSNPGSS